MARVAFPLVLQSPVTGSALVGATATITKHVVGSSLGSGAEAEIFESETESTKVSGNKIVTDNTGRWTQGEAAAPAYAQYFLPEGRYDILISGTGLKSVYITRELVAANATPLSAAERTPLNLVSHSGSVTAVSGELLKMAATGTVTLPAAAENAIVGVFCAAGETTIKTASGDIYGDFITGATSIKLLLNQHVILQSDGTNWFIVGGEPKREDVYQAAVLRENEKSFTPSSAGREFVSVFVGKSTLTRVEVAEVEIAFNLEGEGQKMATFIVNPGQTVKVATSNGENFRSSQMPC